MLGSACRAVVNQLCLFAFGCWPGVSPVEDQAGAIKGPPIGEEDHI